MVQCYSPVIESVVSSVCHAYSHGSCIHLSTVTCILYLAPAYRMVCTVAVTILKLKSKITIFLSESANVEIVVFAKSLFWLFWQQLLLCYWIK